MTHQTENDKKQEGREFIGILSALIIIFIVWYFFPDFLQYVDQTFTHQSNLENLKRHGLEKIGEKFGTFGDSYGSLNTLFSGWAFALLLISLFMQRKELQEQRKELSAQREEISKANEIADSQREITEQQAALLEKQIKEAQVQNFFNILFPLISRKNTYYEIADKYPDSENSFYKNNTGSVFKALQKGTSEIYRNFHKSYQNDFLQKDEKLRILKKMIEEKSSFITPYSYIKHSQYISHFIYIINFIENFNGIEDKDRKIAISIFISDYSHKEILGISIMAIENDLLLEKIKKYKLLNSLFKSIEDKTSSLVTLFND